MKYRIIIGAIAVMLSVQGIRAGEVELTGSQKANETLTRDYGTTGTPAANDALAEMHHVAMKNSVPTTYTVMRTSINTATAGSEKTLFSILTMNNGALGGVLNILGGNVGIGTTTPTATLQVANTSGDLFSAISNGVIRSTIGSFGSQVWYLSNGAEVGSVSVGTPGGAPGMVVFTGASTNRFNILNVGSSFHLGFQTDGTYTGGLNFTTGSKIGINTTTPQEKLDVNGNVLIENGYLKIKDLSTTPTVVTGYSGLFASQRQGTSELSAIDGAGNITQLSSHAEPSSGFDTPDLDPLPWSIHHANTFVGKGQVVNMSRLVRLVEEMSGQPIAESYNLPAGWQVDFKKWQADQVQIKKDEYARGELAREPWVEVKSSEAMQVVDETTQTQGTVSENTYALNPATGAVETKPIERASTVSVPTGRKVWALKDGCRFDSAAGKFYRPRRAEDVRLPDIAAPDLPLWIKARIGTSAVAAKTLSAPRTHVEGANSAAIGTGHVVTGSQSVALGGNLNGVYADRAAAVGGEANQVGGPEAVVLGGHGNAANGAAAVASGVNNRTAGERSLVGGRNMDLAKTAANTFVWGDSATTFTTGANHAFLIFPAGGGAAAIGTDTISTGTRLAVAGGDIQITGGSLIVDGKNITAPDYVFDTGYQLMDIEMLNEYLKMNKHLPGVPSRADVNRNGLNMTQFQMRLLEKVEEQALYLVKQNETMKKQNDVIQKQQAQIDELRAQMNTLMSRTGK